MIKKQDRGFILPTILVFLMILTILGTTIIMISLQTQSQALRHSYVQIAHIASKAAIDYAEEQYELNSAYNGTPEQDLTVTDRYRVTIEVVILYNESSSSKRVQAFGRVYIPDFNATAQFVRDIKASIIRNGVVVANVDPSDYDPLLWLDANSPNALTRLNPPNEQFISSVYGSTNRDITEEGGANASSAGNRGLQNYTGDDLEMSWDGNSLGNQRIGLKWRGVTANSGETIDEAYIQFTTDETKQAGAVQLLVQGIAQDSAASFNGTYAVTNAPKTTASVTWVPPNWNVVGASGANERVNVTSIVQEIVNRPGWVSGNSIAFSVSWITGSGVRTAEKGSAAQTPVLYIRRPTTGGNFASANGDQINSWIDISLNNQNANYAYGTRPILQTNQINGLNAVRFSANGVLRSAITPTASGSSMTAFMVARPRSSGSTNARYLSLMNTAQNSDSDNFNGIVPFMQQSNSQTMQNFYRNQTAETLSNTLNDTWSIYSSRISASNVERLLRNGTDNFSETVSNLNYSINEIFVGGTRSTSSGTNYANFDVAEVVVYNKLLTCTEMQGLEDHFEIKYGISVTTKTC